MDSSAALFMRSREGHFGVNFPSSEAHQSASQIGDTNTCRCRPTEEAKWIKNAYCVIYISNQNDVYNALENTVFNNVIINILCNIWFVHLVEARYSKMSWVLLASIYGVIFVCREN